MRNCGYISYYIIILYCMLYTGCELNQFLLEFNFEFILF